MKHTVKGEDYFLMKEEIIDLLNSDDRMSVYDMLDLVEKHWDYESIKEVVVFKENFFQWEIERLVYNTDKFRMRELVLKKEES